MAVLLTILIILLIPIRASGVYDQGLTFELRYLLWCKKINPPSKPNQQSSDSQVKTSAHNKFNLSRGKQKKKAKKKKSRKLNLKQNFKLFCSFCSVELIKSYFRLMQLFFKIGLRLKAHLDLNFFVSDAAKTGILYGGVCAILKMIPIHKNITLSIFPDFEKQKSSVKFDLSALIFPLGLLVVLTLLLLKILWDFMKFKIMRKTTLKIGKDLCE